MAPRRSTRISAGRQPSPTAASSRAAAITPAARFAPSAAAAEAEAALTAEQRAIRAILHFEEQRNPAETFLLLAELESRDLPEQIQSKELEPRNNPRDCCFDTASVPPAWSQHRVCRRCSLVYQLLQASIKRASSATHKVLLGTAAFVTDCMSSSSREAGKRTSERGVPGLPQELLDLIVDFALDNLRCSAPGSGQLVCALMHTCTLFRFRCVDFFDTVSLYDVHSRNSSHASQLRMSAGVMFYVWALVESHFDADVSVKRYCDDAMESLPLSGIPVHAVVTGTGSAFSRFSCRVDVSVAPPYSERTIVEKSFAAPGGDEHPHVTDRDVCTTLCEILSNERLRDFPRCVAPYMRARKRMCDFKPYINIEITMSFVEADFHPHSGPSQITRIWHYANLPAGP